MHIWIYFQEYCIRPALVFTVGMVCAVSYSHFPSDTISILPEEGEEQGAGWGLERWKERRETGWKEESWGGKRTAKAIHIKLERNMIWKETNNKKDLFIFPPYPFVFFVPLPPRPRVPFARHFSSPHFGLKAFLLAPSSKSIFSLPSYLTRNSWN